MKYTCKNCKNKDTAWCYDCTEENKPDSLPSNWKSNDNINHPAHYTSGKYETIDIIESITNSMNIKPFEGYCLGNIIKYLSRYKHKNGVEDLKKCRWYLDKLIKVTEVENG